MLFTCVASLHTSLRTMMTNSLFLDWAIPNLDDLSCWISICWHGKPHPYRLPTYQRKGLIQASILPKASKRIMIPWTTDHYCHLWFTISEMMNYMLKWLCLKHLCHKDIDWQLQLMVYLYLSIVNGFDLMMILIRYWETFHHWAGHIVWIRNASMIDVNHWPQSDYKIWSNFIQYSTSCHEIVP